MPVANDSDSVAPDALLSPADVREIAGRLGIRPTKKLGQNFVIDGNTVRRIVRVAAVRPEDTVVEVGPGLGSLTLALLDAAAAVVAVEIDPVLARELPQTAARFRPHRANRLTVVQHDALTVRELPGPAPTALVANLPYNVAVPVLLTMLERFPSLERALVMVQAEVADRLAAKPGSRTYGAPSVKAAWFAQVERAGSIGPSVFWPVPNVDSGLVRLIRRPPPDVGGPGGPTRRDVFTVIDAAFAQRRKMLRAALADLAGGSAAATAALEAAGIDPTQRGEMLDISQFVAVAAALRAAGGASHQ